MGLPSFIKKFGKFGESDINVGEVVREWGDLWCLLQHGSAFRLIKRKSHESSENDIALLVGQEQAVSLMYHLDLEAVATETIGPGVKWIK